MSKLEIATELSAVPHIDQYVGVWAMYEPTFRSLFDQAMKINVTDHLASEHVKQIIREAAAADGEDAQSQYRTSVRNNVAVIEATGTLMKHASSFSGGTSTTRLRRSINAAVRDESIGSILLVLDSPGGTAAGTYELAATISNANQSKPVLAHIQDLGASAAYWTASAARSIAVNAPGKVGSIGTYAVIHDLSNYAAKEGVKVHVVRAGSEHKGAGVPGTEITPSQLGEFQRIVDQVNDFFLAGVSQGRNMAIEAVKEIADGRVHIGEEAKSLKLVDHVRSFEESFDEAATLASRKTQVRGVKMSQTTDTKTTATDTQNQPATVNEIESSCPGITAEKTLQYMKDGKTLDQCRDAWMHELATDNAALREKEAAQEAAAKKRPGVEALKEEKSSQKSSGTSPTETFWAAVKELESDGKTRSQALIEMNRTNPELRKAMLAEQSTVDIDD